MGYSELNLVAIRKFSVTQVRVLLYHEDPEGHEGRGGKLSPIFLRNLRALLGC